jgi:outer membrane receptor for ferrienterochelin and colicins
MKYLKFHVLTGVLLLTWANLSNAQTDEDDLALTYGSQPMVSIATGSAQPLSRAPSVATVITAEDIAAIGATDIDQVLETVPGMHVSTSSSSYDPVYEIRGISGAYNQQVLFMINGIPLKNVFIGSPGQVWAGMPVENIARIEVIRGPGSALYGADAFSGVINVITKSSADIKGTEVGARVGAFNSKNTWVQSGGKWGDIDTAVFVEAGHTDGEKQIVTADRQTQLDQSFGTHASYAPGPVNTQHDAIDARIDLGYRNWRWRAGYQERDHVGSGTGVSQVLDPTSEQNGTRLTSDLTYHDAEFAKDWDVTAQMSYAHLVDEHNLTLFPPGTSFQSGVTFPNGVIGDPHKFENQYRFNTSAFYTGFQHHKIRIGTGVDFLDLYKVTEIKNYTSLSSTNATPVPLVTGLTDVTGAGAFITPHSRRVTYLYGQDEWSIAKDWYITAGLRHDNYSDFGGTTNPRLALVWESAYNLTTKLLYGRAFQAPTFTDLYNMNNPALMGNPNVQPEVITTKELAFSWQPASRLQLGLNFFRYEMSNIIQLITDSTGAQVAGNAGRQVGHGMELEAAYDYSRTLRLSGNYSYQHSIDESTGGDAGYAPHNHLYARADWQLMPEWKLHGQMNWVADRKRTVGDNRPPVPDYKTFDLTLQKGTLTPGKWDYTFSIRNMFNATVLEPSLAPGLIPYDLPMPGRTWYVQARYGF